MTGMKGGCWNCYGLDPDANHFQESLDFRQHTPVYTLGSVIILLITTYDHSLLYVLLIHLYLCLYMSICIYAHPEDSSRRAMTTGQPRGAQDFLFELANWFDTILVINSLADM